MVKLVSGKAEAGRDTVPCDMLLFPHQARFLEASRHYKQHSLTLMEQGGGSAVRMMFDAPAYTEPTEMMLMLDPAYTGLRDTAWT